MLTLYWYWSFNPQKARLALEELELEYSLVTVDLGRGGHVGQRQPPGVLVAQVQLLQVRVQPPIRKEIRALRGVVERVADLRQLGGGGDADAAALSMPGHQACVVARRGLSQRGPRPNRCSRRHNTARRRRRPSSAW